jgi:hypothetical protein
MTLWVGPDADGVACPTLCATADATPVMTIATATATARAAFRGRHALIDTVGIEPPCRHEKVPRGPRDASI